MESAATVGHRRLPAAAARLGVGAARRIAVSASTAASRLIPVPFDRSLSLGMGSARSTEKKSISRCRGGRGGAAARSRPPVNVRAALVLTLATLNQP
jgi:hypothetical protein